jgi:hypothetical protein
MGRKDVEEGAWRKKREREKKKNKQMKTDLVI